MPTPSCTVMRTLCLVFLTGSLSCHGEPPRVSTLGGVTLGASPEQVGELLRRQELYCDVAAYGFPDEERTEGIETIFASTVSPDGTRECRWARPNAAATTSLTVRFARKQIDSATGAMSISYEEISSRPSTTIGSD